MLIVAIWSWDLNFGWSSDGSVGFGPTTEASPQIRTTKTHPTEWWLNEDGVFNLDEEGRMEKQQCAVAASNIIRNFSFMVEYETVMAQHRHCLETVFQCIEDHITGDKFGHNTENLLNSYLQCFNRSSSYYFHF